MSKCLTCGDPIEQKTGKRKRLYCSNLCRLRDWQRKNKRPINGKPNPVPKEEKPTEPTPKLPEPHSEAEIALKKRQEILDRIKDIRAEKIPELRNKSVLGQKSWKLEQNKRIQELENQLKII